MIYEVNGDLRSSMLIDGTAEARLADILTIMDKRTFPKRESERIVGAVSYTHLTLPTIA